MKYIIKDIVEQDYWTGAANEFSEDPGNAYRFDTRSAAKAALDKIAEGSGYCDAEPFSIIEVGE